jgi:predicted nucleic acid-binding protein
VKLIDSSCWVDYYRPDGDPRIQAAVAEAIESDDASICGIIRVEILANIAREPEFDAVSEDFSGMHNLILTHLEFNTAVEIGRTLRAKGASVPATDLVIAAAAINHDAVLLHCDRHFLTIGKHSGLKQQAVGDPGKSA